MNIKRSGFHPAAQTGWWDERGVPAPWPEELHEWPVDPPITIDRSVTFDPSKPPF